MHSRQILPILAILVATGDAAAAPPILDADAGPRPKDADVLVGPVAAQLGAAAAAADGAAAPAPPILEAHPGPRPKAADVLLGPVAAELGAAGFASARSTATQLEARLSLPGRTASAAELAAAIAQVDGGSKRVVAGD